MLRAVTADFFFNCWCLEITSDNRIRHVPKCVHYHGKDFDLNSSKIFMLEVEAVPQSCIPQSLIGLSIVLCTRSLLLVERSDVYY
jgi:hypothetical protein